MLWLACPVRQPSDSTGLRMNRYWKCSSWSLSAASSDILGADPAITESYWIGTRNFYHCGFSQWTVSSKWCANCTETLFSSTSLTSMECEKQNKNNAAFYWGISQAATFCYQLTGYWYKRRKSPHNRHRIIVSSTKSSLWYLQYMITIKDQLSVP